jgi:uncharacterized protein with HEPN domain
LTADEVYLRHILDALDRVAAYTKGGRKVFMDDPMIQDATVRNLEIVGEAAKNVSREFRDRHTEVSWSSMAGMRDVLIHNYMGVDLVIVWDVVENRASPLREQISGLLEDEAKR